MGKDVRSLFRALEIQQKSLNKQPLNRGFDKGCSGNKLLCHFFARKFDADALPSLLQNIGTLLSEATETFNETKYLLTSKINDKSVYKSIYRNTSLSAVNLHIVTCDTNSGEHGRGAWYVSAKRIQGIHRIINICLGKKWNGFKTKLQTVINYSKELLRADRNTSQAPRKNVILFSDGVDVFFNTDSAEKIISNWEVARQGKPLLFACELSCWIGYVCSEREMNDIYNISNVSTRAAYINTGVYMGFPEAIIDTLTNVINNHMHLILKYDDQAAVAEYYKTNQSTIALDRTWSVFGTLQMMKALDDPTGFLPKYHTQTFSCMKVNDIGEMKHAGKRCYQVKYELHDLFRSSRSSCTVRIGAKKKMLFEGLESSVLNGLHKSSPVIHGNGRWTKKTLYALQEWGMKCLKDTADKSDSSTAARMY